MGWFTNICYLYNMRFVESHSAKQKVTHRLRSKRMLTVWKQNTIPNVPRTYAIAACWKEKAHLNRFFIPINND